MDFFALREPVNAWTHAAGMILAVPGTLYLCYRGRHARPAKRISLLIFGLSLIFCYGASALFHGVRVPRSALGPFDRLDRIGIFILIAGTYTPLAWSLLQGRWRWLTLASIWLTAVVASTFIAIGGPFAPVWMTGLYLAMGWGVVACYAELARVVSHRALLPLVAGGICYSLGAVINVAHWPILRPGVVEWHELFHLFVIAGSLAHYYLVLKVAIPFDESPRRAVATPSHLPAPRIAPAAAQFIARPHPSFRR